MRVGHGKMSVAGVTVPQCISGSMFMSGEVSDPLFDREEQKDNSQTPLAFLEWMKMWFASLSALNISANRGTYLGVTL